MRVNRRDSTLKTALLPVFYFVVLVLHIYAVIKRYITKKYVEGPFGAHCGPIVARPSVPTGRLGPTGPSGHYGPEKRCS